MKKSQKKHLFFVGVFLLFILISSIVYRSYLSETKDISSSLNLNETTSQDSVIYTYSNQNTEYLLSGGESPIQLLYWDHGMKHKKESIFENDSNREIYFQTALVGFVDEHNGWLFLQSAPSAGIVDSSLFLSDNQGATWNHISLPANFPRHKVNDVIFLDKQVGFICCSLFDQSPAPLFYTFDGGAHWEAIQMPIQIEENTSYQALYIRPIDSNIICAIQCRTSLHGESSYTTKYFLCENIAKINEWNEIIYPENLLDEKISDWEDNHLFKKIEDTGS